MPAQTPSAKSEFSFAVDVNRQGAVRLQDDALAFTHSHMFVMDMISFDRFDEQPRERNPIVGQQGATVDVAIILFGIGGEEEAAAAAWSHPDGHQCHWLLCNFIIKLDDNVGAVAVKEQGMHS